MPRLRDDQYASPMLAVLARIRERQAAVAAQIEKLKAEDEELAAATRVLEKFRTEECP